MDRTHVVTCFLRNRSAVLLIQRSDAVGSYSGLWGGVSGYVEDTPETQAQREIEEETGLEEHTRLVRSGTPLSVVSERYDTEWIVHPYLFDCESRAVTPNEEIAEYEWVSPVEIHRRETVPELWTAYERVAPTVDTIAGDQTHGAEYVSLRALEALRDVAAANDYGKRDESITALAHRLQSARPSMSVVETRINRVLYDADTDSEVRSIAEQEIERARTANDEAARMAAKTLSTERILTLSRSKTVRKTLERLDCSVFVARSDPGGEGVAVAESLAETTDVTLLPDAAIGHALASGIEAVLVGADTVLSDGRVVNKVGTHTAALAAANEDIETYVVTTEDKIRGTHTDENDVDLEHDESAVYDGESSIAVLAPTFDVTPADRVTIITETGVQSVTDIEHTANRHREYAAWE